MGKSLTKRQQEFLALSANGYAYRDIAKFNFVTLSTVKSTLSRARERSKTKTTLQCFARAISREELGIDHNGVVFVPDEL